MYGPLDRGGWRKFGFGVKGENSPHSMNLREEGTVISELKLDLPFCSKKLRKRGQKKMTLEANGDHLPLETPKPAAMSRTALLSQKREETRLNALKLIPCALPNAFGRKRKRRGQGGPLGGRKDKKRSDLCKNWGKRKTNSWVRIWVSPRGARRKN